MALVPDTDAMKRAGGISRHKQFLARMRKQDPRHAALYCPDHPTYIGHNNVFPCTDPDHKDQT